ncbi:SusD/RagB family nutrient-binding outer membrane lipoprotein [uncultured Tenacibaculum sp.]|uniref:SusD/RagB family nutrient-binding outer membrane lipoprotein n=1 Tax=uncultured Tenacibaculum sp. TaxID=174713 RepID=UPI00261BEE5C|nr:SusD/RagB family nutrient-binding outer membrane lipoprotein [uncultured Tenacibaculum sp.]
MKNIKYFILSLVILASCKDYTEGLNTDPNNFSSAAPELIIGQAQLGWMQLAESNGARYAGIFMNQFSGEDRQYLTVEAYSITAGEFDDLWDDAYVEGITQAKLTKRLALEDGNTQLAGVAQITEAVLFGELAALFGDVPFNQASDADNNFAPEYDSQASVFTAVQNLLDEAISNVGSVPASLYAGNRMSSTATWAQIAHSLKARYYLLAKDYPNALTSARRGIDSPTGSLVTLHGTSPENRNLYYQFMVDEREGYLGATGSYLEQLIDLGNTSVNRLISTPGEAQRHAYYFTGTDPNTTSTGVFGQTQSFPLISYEEVKLIEAEAANRTGDTGDVTAFNEVRDALAAQYGGSFPHSTSSGNTLLREIIEEKYITLIGQLQPFHDIRRTDNILGVPAKTGTQIPQRFLYPQVEVDNNPNTPNPLPGLFDATPINQ